MMRPGAELRITRLDPNGTPAGEPVHGVLVGTVQNVTLNGAPLDAEAMYVWRPPQRISFVLRLGKRRHARRLLEVLGVVQPCPWKPAHARRYRRHP